MKTNIVVSWISWTAVFLVMIAIVFVILFVLSHQCPPTSDVTCN